jgi:murein L,D-transpeptidase YcbB/YkuD
MTRRVLLAIPLAGYCRAADAAREVLDLIADLAASLSAGNVALFLQAFDPKMPGFAKLRENVTGLIAQGDMQSLIDPLEDEGDDRRRVAQFDWTLLMHRGQEATSYARREQVLKFSVEKRGSKWRIVELEPIEFFAPGV